MMKKEIVLENKKVAYTLRQSHRARQIRLTVSCGGTVVVTAPFSLGESGVEKFIREKTGWLLDKISFFKQFKAPLVPSGGRRNYMRYKEAARRLAGERARYFNQMYGFSFNRISIKNQKKRWGSCSKKSNLNFNYRIVFLPPALADYIIVHELCHLGELNHSRKFWDLVERAIPNHKQRRRELKTTL
jgi:hypothetical protein